VKKKKRPKFVKNFLMGPIIIYCLSHRGPYPLASLSNSIFNLIVQPRVLDTVNIVVIIEIICVICLSYVGDVFLDA
jgi:hypothetical protein